MKFTKGGDAQRVEFETNDSRKVVLEVKYTQLGDFVLERPRDSQWRDLEVKFVGSTGETEQIVRSYTAASIRIADGLAPETVNLSELRKGLKSKNLRLRIVR